MLVIEDIHLRYGETSVLNGVSLDVEQGEIVCLLGASGSGKTSLLRIVAGLETPQQGRIILAGQSLAGVPTHKRQLGFMFQDYALFPHMNVADNVAFGLQMAGEPRAAREKRVHEQLALVGLAGYEQRNVSQLSGGEQQRVALARSLAPSPRLLMLDEPLGSLDAGLRERLVRELHGIIKQMGLTALYVTHDQAEAFAIADRIAILQQGRLAQIATPQGLYYQPASRYVATFLGLTNFIDVRSIEGEQAQTDYGYFAVDGTPRDGMPRFLLLHPDGLSLADEGIPAIVIEAIFQGDQYDLTLEVSEGVFWQLTMRGRETVPSAGDAVHIAIDPAYVVPLAE
ncbi:ABC transporter ATP-binding protein [Phototrophicus methaneseepsis]|uniref:ABC-type quaternary amine transporter n=1 Tax=Phototrophicus methaneseepsis TaxID=2710758 RepID=A0A7S8E5T3_9CHLR|nr:ABC transporter ATP-binding protein [Phototrophicus methaneseepsis]QPC80906.1 ABC transporter ATP-binding protein [Phototrophicus methaneseepsis]